MRYNLTRDWYKPKDIDPVILHDPEVEYYAWDENGVPYAIGFGGKRSKPDFNYRFRTAEQRDAHIERWLNNQKAHSEYQAKRKAERAKPHTLKLGDILYTSWGYDQTNIDFYQVTKVIGKKMIEIREIGSKTVRNDGGGCDYVVAVRGSFLEGKKPMKKMAGPDNCVRIESYAHARPWDGEPKYETALGWGH